MKLVKVKDYPHLCRDVESNAIINVDRDAYADYITRKNAILAEKRKIEQQGQEINNIKQELCDIKSLLIKLLEVKDANNK